MFYHSWIFLGISAILIAYLSRVLFLGLFKKLAQKTSSPYDGIFISTFSPFIFGIVFIPCFLFFENTFFTSFAFWPRTQDFLWSFFILILTLALVRFLSEVFQVWAKENVVHGIGLIVNLIKVVSYTIGVLVILRIFGFEVTPLLATLGVGGLAVSFALKDTLADFFSGVYLFTSKKIKVGDFIELESGESGRVEDITWRHTLLKEFANNILVIPNSKISLNTLRNFDKKDPSFFFPVKLGVSYDSDLDKVKKVTEEVIEEMMEEVEGVVNAPPVVRFLGFGDSSINLRALIQIKEREVKFQVLDEFVRRIHKRYQKEKIEIPFPIRTLIHKNSSP